MDGLTVEQMVDDLRRSCGIGPGDVLIVHSSMKSIGRVAGGPADVIRALLQAIGPSGTLLMPAFSDPQADAIFSMVKTPSRTGLITETFRTWPGACRSMHPTHSVVAFGPCAKEFTRGHENASPLGPDSPFHRATAAGAKVLMVGCDLTSCSLIHVAEAICRVPYLGKVCYPGYERTLTLVDYDGRRIAFPPRDPPGDSSRFGVVSQILQRQSKLKQGKLGGAQCLVFQAMDALNAAVGLLREDAFAFLCNSPRCPVCPAAKEFVNKTMSHADSPQTSAKSRYVLVGTGGRAATYIDALTHECRGAGSLEAICDLSQTRMDWYNLRVRERFGAPPIPTYLARDFDRMVKEKKPNAVIVTSMDCTHHQYIVRAMELGCDVICEKPLTTDAVKAAAIFDAIRRTGRSLRVTFNMRYTPLVSKVRELMMQQIIGRPLAVSFSWVLDTSHGADYFRRWHREKDKSGGLLVHKASHHFDLINWWISSYPKTVFAMGGLMFYGEPNAIRRGERYSYSRYTGHPEANGDPFRLVLDEAHPGDPHSISALRGLYLNAERETGYIRDRNVFGEGVTAEDVMALCVRYRNGVIMNYSLVAFSPWEGYQVAITGEKGRLEVFQKYGSHIIRAQGADELAAEIARGEQQSIRVFPMFGVPYDVPVPKAQGAHGGGDALMLQHLFAGGGDDPFGRAASHLDGAASTLIGISANESIRTGLPVECDSLLRLDEK